MSISVRHVSKAFGEFHALSDVSLEVEPGSLVAILGPSGSGKSTLLRIIAGLERPDRGSIFVDGTNVTGSPPQERHIGFVFQHYAAFKHMTVHDNIAFGLRIQRRGRSAIRARVDELLDLVELEGLAHRYPSQLSGGQRQRMCLARALAVDPSMLLLDEPFGALDAQVRSQLRLWLRRLHERTGQTTVLVTHDQWEAMEVADRVVVINEGRVEQEAGPRELYDFPANEFVMTFLGQAIRFGDAFVRTDDLHLALDPNRTTEEVMVERLVYLGFEVRITVLLKDGRRLPVRLSRREVEQLELNQGDIVFLKPARKRSFPRASAPHPNPSRTAALAVTPARPMHD